MIDSINTVRYDAFFDELGQIEKRAMLTRVAALSPGFVSQVVRGGRQILTKPGNAVKAVRTAYGRGSRVAAQAGGGRLSQLGGGLERVWKTPQGKAAVVGAGALAGGAGLVGTGAVLGRATA